MYGIANLKVVADPISGIIDIGPVMPIIDTRAFQRLDDTRQLGMTYLVFRGARHTRFMHSLGSYWATRTLADRWLREGFITRDEGDALAVFALLHDVGHPAFSHTSEDFCLKDHHETTVELICGELKNPIEACGVDAGLVASMARRGNPLYRVVCDKNIGTEKLDYLERDGLSTILSRPNGIDYLRKYVYYVDGMVAIDKKIVEHVLDTMNFYLQMYKGVYLRKALVIAQRMFHKALHHLIETGELSPAALPRMTDSELLATMYVSEDPVVQDLYHRLTRRDLFKEGIVIRPQAFHGETRVAHKPIAVVGVSNDEMYRLTRASALQRNNASELESLEASIAKVIGVPDQCILVVPVLYPERFQVQDVNLLGGSGTIHSLKERRPEYFGGMEETGRSYAAIRICTIEEYRPRLCDAGTLQGIVSLINSLH